eukprot:GHVN01051132.1.p1 GENE.GHVN01051132.1~~GHVN01051132.1.p1  ORF type:complete len:564 (+),score=162.02 GHVN01051132.1:2580-4271(+)
MTMMSYDWRLAFPMLEKRDGQLTKWKKTIESFVETTGEKVVIVSHSMGCSLTLFFFEWVTREVSDGGGGGGADWVENHIASFVSLAGPFLGVAKTVPALLSGEMRDTAVLLGPMGTALELFFGRKQRKDLFASWGSLWSMLPKGGDSVWGVGADVDNVDAVRGAAEKIELSEVKKGGGNHTQQDAVDERHTWSPGSLPFVSFTSTEVVSDVTDVENPSEVSANAKRACSAERFSHNSVARSRYSPNSPVSPDESETSEANDPNRRAAAAVHYTGEMREVGVSEVIHLLGEWGSGYGPCLLSPKLHSFRTQGERGEGGGRRGDSGEKDDTRRGENGDRGSSRPPVSEWHNPVLTPLPFAPSLKLYCMYGHGLLTERAYFYKRQKRGAVESGVQRLGATEGKEGGEDGKKRSEVIEYADPPFILDTYINDEGNGVKNGVVMTDGDATVPLVSLGYMCIEGWRSEQPFTSPHSTNALNPSNVTVITREYLHKPIFDYSDPMRAGPHSSDHVDILGNIDTVTDVIKVATGFDQANVEERVMSNIKEIAERIKQLEVEGRKETKQVIM